LHQLIERGNEKVNSLLKAEADISHKHVDAAVVRPEIQDGFCFVCP